MNSVDRIESLERRVKELENRIEKLVNEQETQTSTHQRLISNEIEVQQIKIVEKDGTVRMSIHNKECMPTFPERRGGSSAGMLFFAEDGDEIGGLTIQNTVGLRFDQHHSSDVVGLVDYGSIRGLYVWDRPPGPREEFMEQFEKQHGRKPAIKEFELDRVFVGRWLNGEAKISLCDSRGNERLRVLVDSNDMPRLEMLNEQGEIIHYMAPDSYTPIELPSLDSIPSDKTGRTPVHMLGVFDYNVDTALQHLDQDNSRRLLGRVVFEKWREWMMEVKRINPAYDAE